MHKVKNKNRSHPALKVLPFVFPPWMFSDHRTRMYKDAKRNWTRLMDIRRELEPTKWCRKCNEFKNTEGFAKDNRTRDGWQDWCKACHKEDRECRKRMRGKLNEIIKQQRP